MFNSKKIFLILSLSILCSCKIDHPVTGSACIDTVTHGFKGNYSLVSSWSETVAATTATTLWDVTGVPNTFVLKNDPSDATSFDTMSHTAMCLWHR